MSRIFGSNGSNTSEIDEGDLKGNIRKLLEGQQRVEQILHDLVQPLSGSAEGGEDRGVVTTTNSLGNASLGKRQNQNRRGSSSSETLLVPSPTSTGIPNRMTSKDSLTEKNHEAVTRGVTTSWSLVWLRDLEMRKELQGTLDDLIQACSIERLNDDADVPVDDRAHATSSLNEHGNGRRPCLVWSPTSRALLCMDLLSVLVLSYDVLSLPYLLAFEVPQEGAVLQLSMASVCFWVCDVAFRFRTGYWRDAFLEMRPYMIAKHYLRTTFALDTSLVLLDIVALALSLWGDSQPSETDASRLWRIGKVTRFVRCISFLRLRAVSGIVQRVSSHSKALQATSVVIYDVVRIVFAILWLNHIIACGWVVLGRLPSDTGISWLDQPISELDSVARYRHSGPKYQYTTAFHWALTQMTPGSMQVFPQNSDERIYNNICLVFGVLVFSTMISSISSTVTQFKLGMQSNNAKMEKLNRFLQKASLDPQLSMQVRKQVQEKLKFRKPIVFKDVEVLELLPLSLVALLQMELCRPHMMRHSWFYFILEADAMAAEELCRTCTEFSVLGSKDTLFLRGVDAVGMFFVTSGSLQYVVHDKGRGVSSGSRTYNDLTAASGNGESHAVEKGEWLSEAALWCYWRHMGSSEVPGSSCEIMQVYTDKLIAFTKKRTIGQTMWAYALSFYTFLVSADACDSSGPTDLRLPFTVEEVIAALPKEARDYVGRVAIKTARTSMRITPFGFHLGAPDLHRITEELEQGEDTLVLAAKQKFGVQRVISTLALQLIRDDGRIFVELRRPEERELAEAKLPCLKQDWGERSDQCFQRLVRDHFSEWAHNITLEDVERDSTTYEEFGITTMRVRTLYTAQLEVAQGASGSFEESLSEPTALASMQPQARQSSCGSQESLPPPMTRASNSFANYCSEASGSGDYGHRRSQRHQDSHRESTSRRDSADSTSRRDSSVVIAVRSLASTGDELGGQVFELPDGKLATWFTPQEYAKCNSENGRIALTQWLKKSAYRTGYTSEAQLSV